MFHAGLVSISFRENSPEEIVKACVAAGLRYIEWGSDVHAPCNDPEKLNHILELNAKYGVSCCSYGTYFRLGVTPVEELPQYFRAAKVLGTNIVRIWVGTQHPCDMTQEQKEALFADARRAAKMAEEAGIILCAECHDWTYTETKESALELMQAANSPAFKMYWQPNQNESIEENLAYARLLKDYIVHIHVFQWKGRDMFPLEDGIQEWKDYLKEIPGDHFTLLEHMPDHKIETLERETKSLWKILEV